VNDLHKAYLGITPSLARAEGSMEVLANHNENVAASSVQRLNIINQFIHPPERTLCKQSTLRIQVERNDGPKESQEDSRQHQFAPGACDEVWQRCDSI
jgi:hypothetical protein